MTVLIAVSLVAVLAAVIATIIGMLVTRLYRKVQQGQALIISRTRSIEVSFTGAFVVPVVHRAEVMDVGVKVIDIEKAGNDGLICKDNMRADIKVSFYVRVNPNADDVRKVAQLVGCAAASDPQKLQELFSAKFAEALKTAGKQMDFVQLYDMRDHFRSNVINVIGEDLNGYLLDDVAIEYLEQTPIGQLDPTNVLDAEGIKKITEITAREGITANSFRRDAEKQIKAKDVETQQAVFEMERQEKAAEYRAQREMAVTKAREESTTAQVEAEERLKSEQARLRTDESVGIQKENLQREVDVAAKARERVVAVETEKVEKARQLEIVAREIETTSARKDLQTEQTRMAELAKARIAVERTVAEQEEAILTLRRVEDANRQKESLVIMAGAHAESTLITTIKQAEADEKAAEHRGRERLTLATAAKDAAELESTAKIRMAEGVRAEAAAEGLAEVEVRRAEAQAIEQQGVAQARVKEADVAAELRRGEAMAMVARLAGEADGAASEARLRGEAAGLAEKAEAMRALEGVGKEYDLAVRQMDNDRAVRLASVEAQRDMAKSQAEALGLALSSANIDIVGGTDLFVDRMLSAASFGKAVDGMVNSSDTTKALAAPYVNGEKDLLGTVADALGGLGAAGIANLTLARLLTVAADRLGGEDGDLLKELIGSLRDKGFADVELRQLANGR